MVLIVSVPGHCLPFTLHPVLLFQNITVCCNMYSFARKPSRMSISLLFKTTPASVSKRFQANEKIIMSFCAGYFCTWPGNLYAA